MGDKISPELERARRAAGAVLYPDHPWEEMTLVGQRICEQAALVSISAALSEASNDLNFQILKWQRAKDARPLERIFRDHITGQSGGREDG